MASEAFEAVLSAVSVDMEELPTEESTKIRRKLVRLADASVHLVILGSSYSILAQATTSSSSTAGKLLDTAQLGK